MSINSKKNLSYIIILVLTLLVFVAASTFAYFSMIASKEKDSTEIYTGTVLINYHQGDIIKGTNLIPCSNFNGFKEPSFNQVKNVYKNNFTVSNNGTLPVSIDIIVDISNNEFSHNILKYILFDKKGNKLSSGSIPKTGDVTVASNIYLSQSTSDNYTIMIWLEDNGTDQNYEMGKSLVGKILVNAVNK